jgi:putative aminopeptidase FrvX
MTKKSILSKLEKNGYKVTFTMTGNVIASKGNQSYSASSLSALKIKLFN